MESRKRTGYGFRGYEAPALPRAMRSARGRGAGCRKKTEEGNGMEYFELLATVAGELLQKQETHEPGSELRGIEPLKGCNKMLGSGFAEGESSPEQASLALDRSHILTNGNALLRRGPLGESSKLDPGDQGSCDENAIASGTSHRNLILEKPPIKEDPDLIIQSISTSTSGISKSDFGQSLDREKGPGLLVGTENVNEKQLQGVCSLEGEAKLGSSRTEKERYSRNSCEGGGVTEKALLDLAQGLPNSGGELLKVPMGLVENGEGKGENEIDEKNLGRWKTGEAACENTEDELMLDAHSLLASSGVSGGAPMCIETKPPPLVSSDSSGEATLHVGSKPHDSFFNDPNNKIKVCRDDDDNSSGCTIPISSAKKNFRSPCFRVGKLRRAISSRFRKAITASSNKRKRSEMDVLTNADRMVKTQTPGCGAGFTWQRTARCSPSKTRRLDDGTFILTSDAQTSTASATDLDSNRADGEPPASAAKMRRAKSASVASSPASAPGSLKHSANKSGESHVKLSIKSFTVPELFIDMPESATVASLKRTVMEAAMNLLGGGFRVRVLLQGMVIPDEGDTLLQVGISHGGNLESVGYGGKLESVGFMLEPNPVPTSPACAEDPLFVLSRAATQPSSRFPVGSTPGSAIVTEGNKGLAKGRCNKIKGMAGAEVAGTAGETETEMQQWPKSEYEMKSGSSHEQSGSNAGALVVHPGVDADSVQGLALVPLSYKSRGSEIGKRRIRRPFTVAEVEALVHAVEKLGTGRWRDVKLRAFDHAKHRTYVDLKDKWKTLVHTARIAPHKRRGEPVPQDLLDRVICAHTYWTDKQAKQQAELCL